MTIPIIKTSHQGWLKKLAVAYKEKSKITIIDDAHIGIDFTEDYILDMGIKAKLTPTEFTAVCVAIGMSSIGVGMVLLAFIDPEPTTKLGLLVSGGAILVLLGGLSAIKILTNQKPPNVRVGVDGIEIDWA